MRLFVYENNVNVILTELWVGTVKQLTVLNAHRSMLCHNSYDEQEKVYCCESNETEYPGKNKYF